MKFLELYIGAVVLWCMVYFVGNILFENKEKIKLLKSILTIAIFSLVLVFINMVNSEILEGIIKIILVYSLQCLFYKTMFKKTISKVLLVALVLYLCLFTSEVIVVLITSVITNALNHSMLFIKNNIVMNVLIAILNIIIVTLGKEKLIALVRNNSVEKKSYKIVIFIILVTLALLVFKIPFNEWSFNIDFIITMIILLCFCFIGLFLLKQKADIQKNISMYQQLAEYSNITNDVLEEYRIVTHEHKNQLLIIRSMLENKDKDINDYVDNLLEKREGIKYKWIGDLNHLPLSGLKGLINYKILEMESLNLNKVISISKEISKIKLDKLPIKQKDNLYSIIGVYLDNAIQAAKESKEKEINIEIYKESKELVIIIANTYKGSIDIEKISNYGYTTKGKNHGIGLHIVKNIVQRETIYDAKTYMLDNYFVQEIRIDLKQIKKK